MKICNQCNLEKDIKEFTVGRNKCKCCTNLNKKPYYQKNKEYVKKKASDHYYLNHERGKKIRTEYRESNRDLLNKNRRDAKDKYNKTRRDYFAKYPHINNNQCAKRRASRLNATPKWLTKEQLQEIKDLYKEADRLSKETGIKHSVDHIIPLTHSLVCGLHVPWNLQILTTSENSKKKNKFCLTNTLNLR